MKRLRITALVFLMAVATGAALVAQVVPADSISNWSAPATWSPARTSGGIVAMTDISSAHPFVAINPCRIADTRAGQGFGGQAGPPALGSFANRSFQITGSPGTLPAPPNGCDTNAVPAGAAAVSVNFTVVFPTSSGNLIAWPTGGVLPNVSVLNWDAGTVSLGNTTVVPLSAGGALSLRLNTAGVGQTTEVVIDINGYYAPESADAGTAFIWQTDNSGSFGAARIRNLNAAGSNAHGVTAISDSTGSGSTGLFAQALGVTAANVTYGVHGRTVSTATGAAGVLANHDAATGEVYGLLGDNDSSTPCSAGVWGRSGANLACNVFGNNAGVLGTNTRLWGVLGASSFSSGRGVQGARMLTDNTAIGASGVLGYVGNSGVHSFNDVTAGGMKPFVVPYVGDASKQIMYIAAEADEALTMTRGRGRFERGLATIQLPRHFQLVTEEEGLSIQVTPIGEMANVAVVSLDLERGITLRASRSVEFFYTVHGVRRGYAEFEPVQENIHFVPNGPNEKMDPWPEHTKKVLIQNGIYKEDGMPNVETAKRMGWDKVWQADEARVRAEQEADREARERGLPEGSIAPRYEAPSN